jgi:steroid delta-isomerase-like uncharacterized protein
VPGCILHREDARPGRAGIREFIEKDRAAFPDLHVQADEMIVAEGDRVVVRWTASGTHTGGRFMNARPSGKAFTISGIDIFRLADGRVAEIWQAEDALGLLQQLGIVAVPAEG